MVQNNRSDKSDKINWHSAAFSALKIEFSQNSQELEFQTEYPLNTGPRRIDMIIIKKKADAVLQNPIGRIFQTYNLIEYKSPQESLNINSYYKSISYALSYKTLRFGKEHISLNDISLTLISFHFPHKLFKELKERKIIVAKKSKGIYYINKELIKIQLVITSKLEASQHIWLKSLTNKSSSEQEAQLLAKAYAPHQEKPDYQNFMNILIHSRLKAKETDIMCEAMYELFAPQLQKNLEDGIAIGRKEGLAAGKELGITAGREQGLLTGIKALILDNMEEQESEEQILAKLMRLFSLSQEEANRYLKQYKQHDTSLTIS